ncbi:MAG: hypothetical protein C4527_18365 [Candidatus Omnitrophota bacterium]|nr:MAG: hypothetical protein C4527_18365 [Candidatus Omnitrophota bacterium]
MNKNYLFFVVIALVIVVIAINPAVMAQTIQPIYRAAFDDANFNASGWKFLPSGTGEFQPAEVAIGLIPTSSVSPDISNGRGVIITALAGQGSLVYGPVIPVQDNLVLLRLSLHALSAGGSLAMGALDVSPTGSLATIDGSVTYAIETDSGSFTNDYQRLTVLYRPKSRALIPVFQLAVNPSSNAAAVIAMFDNFEVIPLNANTVTEPALQSALGITIPTVQPTPTPTSLPFSTPTPTPTPILGQGIVTEWLYTFSPTDDAYDALSPRIAYDHQTIYAIVAADQTGGFPDILLRDIDSQTGEVTEPATVNETFEDTETEAPDIAIDFGGIRHVVWSDDRSIEKLKSIYLAQLDSFGQRLVEQDFEANILFEETNAIDPALAVRDNGDTVICWTDDRSYFMDLYIRRVHWAGDRIETLNQEDILVNIPRESTNVSHPDIVMDDNGKIAVVWSDDRARLDAQKRSDIYAAFFSFDTSPDAEGKLPETIVRMQLSTLDQILDHATKPQAALANGRVVVVWENYNPSTGTQSIHGTVTNMNGQLLQGEFIIDGGAAARSFAPTITALNGDLFMITWYDEATKKVYARIFDAGTHLFMTNPTLIDEDVNGLNALGIATDGQQEFFTVWDALSGPYHDLFGASGRWANGMGKTAAAQTVSFSDASVKAHEAKVQAEKRRMARNEKKIRAEKRYSDKRR